MAAATHQKTGRLNKRLVLSEILRQGSISRTEIGSIVGLNAASISRITRELLDAELIRESEESDSNGRRGRRFVQLSPHSKGGYVIGIGINAFRQSVSLANIANEKIASWEAEGELTDNGTDFIRLCAEKAAELIAHHVTDPSRVFGIGVAAPGSIDFDAGIIRSAPIMGWDDSVDVKSIINRYVDAPVVLETPSSAINMAETTFGIAQGRRNALTINCSLMPGIGLMMNGKVIRVSPTTGGVLSDVLLPTNLERGPPHSPCHSFESLLSARTLVTEFFGKELQEKKQPLHHCVQQFNELITRDIAGDAAVSASLDSHGASIARAISMLVSFLPLEQIILAGPMSGSPSFVSAFRSQLALLSHSGETQADVVTSEMTHIGASRWLAIEACLMSDDVNIDALKQERIH